jgi:hypothetical protein
MTMIDPTPEPLASRRLPALVEGRVRNNLLDRVPGGT